MSLEHGAPLNTAIAAFNKRCVAQGRLRDSLCVRFCIKAPSGSRISNFLRIRSPSFLFVITSPQICTPSGSDRGFSTQRHTGFAEHGWSRCPQNLAASQSNEAKFFNADFSEAHLQFLPDRKSEWELFPDGNLSQSLVIWIGQRCQGFFKRLFCFCK